MEPKSTKVVESMQCGECGQHVAPPHAFHPYLYCLLFRNGITDQEKYLRDSGFERGR